MTQPALARLWSDIVKRYLDRDPAFTFVVSGSSSLLLESESSESVGGRLDMLRLSPPDFIFGPNVTYITGYHWLSQKIGTICGTI
jgi:predicted AAA+ superfamily ATPase